MSMKVCPFCQKKGLIKLPKERQEYRADKGINYKCKYCKRLVRW